MSRLSIDDAGRYENVFLGDDMVMSYDTKTGEVILYDPYDNNEEPTHVIVAGVNNE